MSDSSTPQSVRRAGGRETVSENRVPAQYCPYCGETNLWPDESGFGAWRCRDCLRVFSVRFIGLMGRSASVHKAAGVHGQVGP